MKKYLLAAVVVLAALSMLCGCGKLQEEVPAASQPSILGTDSTLPSDENNTSESVQSTPDETTPAQTDDETGQQAESLSDSPYSEQIERYYTALSEKWDEGAYFENEMSHMAAYYYEGNALDNVGYTLMDLDRDGSLELVIGAIMNSELDPLVFEIWTLSEGEPVMLAQSGSRNRYYLQYSAEDDLWSVAYEAGNGAANHAVYYLQLANGKLEVIEAVIFDAMANEEAPWFIAYDLDWDVSNDSPVDEETADAVMKAGRDIYIAADYISYSLCK